MHKTQNLEDSQRPCSVLNRILITIMNALKGISSGIILGQRLLLTQLINLKVTDYIA